MTATAPTIFVQIASYRDPECQWTVRDLFEKADRPESVTVGICWQRDPELDRDCFTAPSPRPAQTKEIFVLPSETGGVCWARAKTQEMFADEDYVLMIDSHMRFIPGWDTALVEELSRCDSPKPFLSTYPPGYKPPDRLEQNPRPIVMRAKPFDAAGDIRFDGESLPGNPERPLRGAFLAAGLLFAPGAFVREVPYDPYAYFNHEEIMLAARAFTHGWDVYSPTRAIIYHYYNDPAEGAKRPTHWADNRNWESFLHSSRQRYNYLLAGVPAADPAALKDIERYGLGAARGLAEYEAFSGLDFRTKTASERALKSGFIEGLDRYRAAPPAAEPETAALKPGDTLHPYALKDGAGAWQQVPPFPGKPAIACLLPSHFDDFPREIAALYAAGQKKFRKLGVAFQFVAPVPLRELAAFRARCNLPEGLLADEDGQLRRMLGAFDRIHDTPVSCVTDGEGRILSLHENRNAFNHMTELLQAAEKLAQS